MDGTLVRFRDRGGVLWQVWEVGQRLAHAAAGAITGEYPPVRTAGWLCFESEGERRRLSHYPYKWWKLPRQMLEQLCELAVPARAPSRSPSQSDIIERR